MPAFTTNQWVVVFLVLVLGWLLGLISRSGGAKWRRAYEAERDARVEEQREQAAELEAANARIAELERALPASAAIAAAPSAPVMTHHNLDLRSDDLGLIRGIGPVGAVDLNEQGIYRYSDLTAMSAEDEAALEDHLGADRGYIAQERWREQAALLDEGRIDEHRARFG